MSRPLMKLSYLAIFIFLITIRYSEGLHVTCGSVIKLRHVSTGYRLHSHQINWGSGSGQQSVTANASADDQGEYFLVKEANGSFPCEAGTPILCNSEIRLEHMLTRKNLHTHDFPSPLARLQEVSAFGDDGEGDRGDNWSVLCINDRGNAWTTEMKVRFHSSSTNKFLHSSSSARFNQSNCPHCPIIGQQEVSAHHQPIESTIWIVEQGLFLSSIE